MLTAAASAQNVPAFIAGEGKSLPAEYQKPGHAAAQVVDEIASWITIRAP